MLFAGREVRIGKTKNCARGLEYAASGLTQCFPIGNDQGRQITSSCLFLIYDITLKETFVLSFN